MLADLTDLRDHLRVHLDRVVRVAIRPDHCSDDVAWTHELVWEAARVELVGHVYTLTADARGNDVLAFGLCVAFDERGEVRVRFCLNPKVRRPLEAVRTFTTLDDVEWSFELETSLVDLGVIVPRPDDHSLCARIIGRLAASHDPLHPWSDAMKREIERTMDAPVPELLAVFFAHHLGGGLGPLNGTLSLADRRGGCFWERLVKFPGHAWIPAFDDGCGHYVLVDANDPEGPLLLDGAQSIHRLDLTLSLLLELWLSGTLDRSTWSIEGEHDSMLPREVAARRSRPSITVRGTRLRPA